MPADPLARRLQTDYIARNPNPDGKRDKLLAGSGGSPYDAVHARYHPALKHAAETVGFYDINLMDAATGDVAYTLLRPYNYAAYHLANYLAERLLRFITTAVIGATLATLYVGPIPLDARRKCLPLCRSWPTDRRSPFSLPRSTSRLSMAY